MSPFQPHIPCVSGIAQPAEPESSTSTANYPLAPEGIPPTASAVSEQMEGVFGGVLKGESPALLIYLELSKRCREIAQEAPQLDAGCNKASLQTSDSAFVAIATAMAVNGDVNAQQALGVWWYRSAEGLFGERLSGGTASMPVDRGDAKALEAEMLALRMATPGFPEALAKSVYYLRQAKAQGYSEDPYLAMMTRNGWLN